MLHGNPDLSVDRHGAPLVTGQLNLQRDLAWDKEGTVGEGYGG